LFDNRQGRRTGFSLVAYDDILTLRQLNEHLLAMPVNHDLEEEAKLRAAWAAAQRDDEATARTAGGPRSRVSTRCCRRARRHRRRRR
jgi:hypothetical protein